MFALDTDLVKVYLRIGKQLELKLKLMQALDNLGPENKKLDIPERLGHTMKHAGVSITVTSITDMAAFLIGSSTVTTFYYLKLS